MMHISFVAVWVLILTIHAVAVPMYEQADYYYDDEQHIKYNSSYMGAYSHSNSPAGMVDYPEDDPYQSSSYGSRGSSEDGVMYSESYDSRRGSGHAHQNGRLLSSRGAYEDPADQAQYDFQNARQDVHPLYQWDDCQYIDDQRYVINGTSACAADLAGVDAHADLLEGGLDGAYRITGCFDGKPLYEREGGPTGEERSLFYNMYYGEWQFSIGPEPNEDQLVMYSDFGYLCPMDVARWHLAVAFSQAELELLQDKDEDVYFVASGVQVRCSTDQNAQATGQDLKRKAAQRPSLHDEI